MVKIGDIIYTDREGNESEVHKMNDNGDCQVFEFHIGWYWISYELVLQYNKSRFRDKIIEEILNEI